MPERRMYPFESYVSGWSFFSGCCPALTLADSTFRLNNSHIYHQTQHDLKARGIDVEGVKLNLPAMLAAKNASVKSLTGGIESYLFKKNGIDYIKGTASFDSANKINVKLTEGGETQVETKNTIIATGSEVTPFPGITIDEKRIVSSTGALDLQEVPKKVSCLGKSLVSALIVF